MPQTIRFVGGPYHGRTLAVSETQQYAEVAVLRRSLEVFSDRTVDPAFAPLFDTERYVRTWLERKTPTLHVREQVMLLDAIYPFSDEAQRRWQELRVA